jgi:hypothetical protein
VSVLAGMKLLFLLVPALALAGCGGATGRPIVAAYTPPTAAGNRTAAEAEARALLALTPLPPGANPTTTRPALLSGPPLGSVLDASLVDQSSFWRVDRPADQTLAWIKAHPPTGLSRTGSGMLSTPTAKVHGLGWGAPDTAAWRSAQLQVGIAADGDSASVIRADGMAVWLDPVPVRDSGAGPRLRVTVAGGCPATDRGYVGVTNPDQPDLDAALLPGGSPTAGLVCEFTKSPRLTSHRTLDATAAARVAAQARALPLGHSLGGPHSCPADFASVVVLALSYPGRPDVDLWLKPNGCGRVGNGHVETAVGNLPASYAVR